MKAAIQLHNNAAYYNSPKAFNPSARLKDGFWPTNFLLLLIESRSFYILFHKNLKKKKKEKTFNLFIEGFNVRLILSRILIFAHLVCKNESLSFC